MSVNAMTDRQKGLVAAIITAVTWSLLAIFLKYGLRYADSYTIVWYRFLTAFVCMFFWFLAKNQLSDLKILFSRPGLPAIAAVCLAGNYVGFMQGVHYTSPANTQIFIQLGPLLLALSGIFIFKESLSRKQLIGFALCLAGFSLFFLDRLEKINGNEGQFYLGLIWIVFAAGIWAIFASLQKYLLDFWKSGQINIYIYLVATLCFLPLVDWSALRALPLGVHCLYIFLGLNTIVAYGFLSIALKYLPATQVSPILVTNPLLTLCFIAIIDIMQWGFIPADPVGLTGYIGAVVAILGVRFVLTRPARPKVQRP